MDKAIVVKNVKKKYKLYSGTRERILDIIVPGRFGEEFYALSGIDFKADMGEVIGFVGINGSGKSTLSNIIAGIVPESSGTVSTNGQVALIAVSAGLKNDLTGRDNIELKLLMLGLSKDEIKELEPEIIEFAELEKFIDQPVKSYSSGMKSRLGFAISVSVDPDILVIDEALSVGDKAFAEKCLDKMKEFKQDGKTMIFVSHSIGQMKRFCDKILWLEFGKVKEYGAVQEVMPKYEAFLDYWKKISKAKREEYKQNVINNKEKTFDIPIPEVVQEQEKSIETIEERAISRMGIINQEECFIYNTPNDLNVFKSAHPYKKSVYYIKRKITYNDEIFYLLSNQPSAKSDVIGWMKAKDVKTRQHTTIDEDNKTFIIIGTGKGFNRPWGSEKNYIYNTLNKYKNNEFHVIKTDRVGKTLWYYGLLDDKKVWIHENDLKD